MDKHLKCPVTRTGEPLAGTSSIDSLIALQTYKDKPFSYLKPHIASAFTELMLGYITHIDIKDPDGFYFTNDKGSYYLEFSYLTPDILNTNKVYVNKKVSLQNDIYVVKCNLKYKNKKYYFVSSSKYKNQAILISTLVVLLSFKRDNEEEYKFLYNSKEDFSDKLVQVLPKLKKDKKGNWLSELIKTIRR